MTINSANLRRRWIRLLEDGFPRARNVLVGLARTPEDRKIAEPLLDLMIAEGTVVMYGERRAAAYGLPRRGRK